MRDVYSDPRAAKFLRGFNSRPAAAERIQHDIAWLATRFNDAL